MKLPKKLQQKITNRQKHNSLRTLLTHTNLIDFSSNDYLSFGKSEKIFDKAHQFLIDHNLKSNGATGSRLLSGNHNLYNITEAFISKTHKSEAALIFNSGYDANIGFFSSVPQRGDIILYDEFIHASIRDGIKLSNAKSYKFKHNDTKHLNKVLKRVQHKKLNVYVVTESVFSMDGDSPDLISMVKIIKKCTNTYFIVDEAHAIGVFKNGLVEKLGLENEVFAQIVTYGKAMGCHGAAILGSQKLKTYLINFSRSFIYTTGLPPHSLATIKTAYDELLKQVDYNKKLQENITHFKNEVKRLRLNFIKSHSTIHCCIISGTKKTKTIATQLLENNFNVKPILSPTVPTGKERLRFCLHSHNSTEEITKVLELLTNFTNLNNKLN